MGLKITILRYVQQKNQISNKDKLCLDTAVMKSVTVDMLPFMYVEYQELKNI